jgi:hypothetical protein
MEKGTNAAFFPNAELIVNATEYNWWTDPARVEKLYQRSRAVTDMGPIPRSDGRDCLGLSDAFSPGVASGVDLLLHRLASPGARGRCFPSAHRGSLRDAQGALRRGGALRADPLAAAAMARGYGM